MKAQIATILENGEYGQREMTNEEYASYIEQQKNSPQTLETQDDLAN